MIIYSTDFQNLIKSTNTKYNTEFQPTYLYIKQHTITGKLYFGKTQTVDVEKYLGSGTRWKRHITKHGKEHVITLWYCLFTDKESIIEFALSFSIENDITVSTIWLNLQLENGLDGVSKGTKLSQERKEQISKEGKGKKKPIGFGHKISNALTGVSKSKEHCENLSKALTNNINLMKLHTEETKCKIGQSNTGKTRSDECKNNLSLKMKGNSCKSRGTKWYKNNNESMRFKENEQPDGWILGRILNKRSKNKKSDNVWINNSIIEKCIPTGEIIPDNFTLGRLHHKRNDTILICPHCGKANRPGNSKRYHFDKCKLKS